MERGKEPGYTSVTAHLGLTQGVAVVVVAKNILLIFKVLYKLPWYLTKTIMLNAEKLFKQRVTTFGLILAP